GDVEGQPGDQHGVRGAPERDRSAPQRAEGPQDLSLLEGLAVSRGGHLLGPLLLQLLLAGADAGLRGWRRPPREANTGDGGGIDRPRLVDVRVAVTPSSATLLSHEGFSGLAHRVCTPSGSVNRG